MNTNMLIEGDNKSVMCKLSENGFQNAVDMVYADPPYRSTRVKKYENRYPRDEWLGMFRDCVEAAKPLLKLTGTFMASIDDEGYPHVRLLLDEVFGVENYVGTFIWQKRHHNADQDAPINTVHEHVLFYAIDATSKKAFKYGQKEIKNKYRYKDRATGVRYNLECLVRRSVTQKKSSLSYTVQSPDGKKQITPRMNDGSEGRWLYSKATFDKQYEAGNIEIKTKAGHWHVYRKIWQPDVIRIPYNSILDDVGITSTGTRELQNILGKREMFQYPKPIAFMKRLISIGAPDNNALILDCFAGSGTTGHACMLLNKEEKTERKFILIQNDENNICRDVTYPRLKAAVDGYKDGKGKRIRGLKALDQQFSFWADGVSVLG